jgi:hypothetical protein
MEHDPCPIPYGSEGVVDLVTKLHFMNCTQIIVRWDSGRSLILCVPPDQFEVIQ